MLDIITQLNPLIQSVTSSFFTLIACFLGFWCTYYFAIRRSKFEKERDFTYQQITKFYSPLVVLQKRIETIKKLKKEFSYAGNEACKKRYKDGHMYNDEDKKYSKQIKKEIEIRNQEFPKYILPLYDRMVDIFEKNYWLAENNTKNFYKTLLSYVEKEHKYYSRIIPLCTFNEIDFNDKDILLFYKNIEETLYKLKKTN